MDEYFPRQLALEAEILDGLPDEWVAQLIVSMDELAARLRRHQDQI